MAWDGKADNYNRLPSAGELKLNPAAAYVHITSNETIQGVQLRERAGHRRGAAGGRSVERLSCRGRCRSTSTA